MLNLQVTYTIIAALVFVLLCLEIQKKSNLKTKNMFCIIIDSIFFLLTIPPYVIKTVKWELYVKLTEKVTLFIQKTFSIETQLDSDWALVLYAGILLILTLLVSLISSRLKSHLSNSDVKVITVSENLIYFEMNKNSKVTNVLDNFYDVFKDNRSHLEFKKIVSEIKVNGKKIKINKLNKELSKAEFDPSCNLEVTLKTSNVITLELYKVERYKKNKLVGYNICNRNSNLTETAKLEVVTGSKSRILNIVNLLPIEIAVYDDINSVYIINKKFADLLEIESNEVTYSYLSNLVYQEDYDKFVSQVYDKRVNTESFRLLTKNGYLWFEQKTHRNSNQDFNVIVASSLGLETKVKPLTYMEMVRDIDVKFKGSSPFAIAILSFKNILQLTNGLNRDFCEELIKKYFEKLAKKLNITNLKTYRFGDIEYGILFENYEEYNLILRGLKNRASILLECDVYVNESRFSLKNKIGICEASQIEEKNPETMIKAALEALDICNDVNYPNDYSIFYHYKKKEDYSLKTYGISFDDDYLDSIYKVK